MGERIRNIAACGPGNIFLGSSRASPSSDVENTSWKSSAFICLQMQKGTDGLDLCFGTDGRTCASACLPMPPTAVDVHQVNGTRPGRRSVEEAQVRLWHSEAGHFALRGGFTLLPSAYSRIFGWSSGVLLSWQPAERKPSRPDQHGLATHSCSTKTSTARHSST